MAVEGFPTDKNRFAADRTNSLITTDIVCFGPIAQLVPAQKRSYLGLHHVFLE